ncbi:Fic family protein [Candidatus Poriferisodalis sp.]|uniref:Fic family protein n=1 Tax=Candidatus Poriferisodalis sp. TaxID=3101277 RepID=UPI003C6EEB3C
MNRTTGHYVITHYKDEKVRAFVPDPLPPDPSLHFGMSLINALHDAANALGRLDGAAQLLPNEGLLLYSYLRKEAVLSSQIEGTQSTFTDLLRYEVDEAAGAPLDDDIEVSNYVRAFVHARDQLDSPNGLPLCNRLLRGVHEILLTGTRGSKKLPGEFRKSQVWIGGTRPSNARFVPPPHEQAAEAISDLEKFLHQDDELPALVRAGRVHVQFETIHPFLDGNGRVGRMLILLVLLDRGVLSTPALYLSLHFKRHRSLYYELLDAVRTRGDWEAWIAFFLEAVTVAANSAVETARRIAEVTDRDRAQVQQAAHTTGGTLRVLRALGERPVTNINRVADQTGLSRPTVATALSRLCGLGVAREVTGRARDRVFVYTEYLDILDEDTEPL